MTNGVDQGAPPPTSNLAKAMAALSPYLRDWNGEPNAAHLSAALHFVSATYARLVYGGPRPRQRNYFAEVGDPSRSQHLDNIALLDALAEAIGGQTVDGWKLTLTGARGPRATSTDFDEKLQIAAFVLDKMRAGDGYLSAVTAAKDKFRCGGTKVKDAYAELKWFVDYILAIQDKSPDTAVNVLAMARANPD